VGVGVGVGVGPGVGFTFTKTVQLSVCISPPAMYPATSINLYVPTTGNVK
jgi:hypothetical protein